MRTSGPLILRLKSSPAFTTRRRESLPRRMEESRLTTIRIRSAWNGKLPGARHASTTYWNRDGSSLRRTCLRCKRIFTPTPMIAENSRRELRRLLLEPRLGSVPVTKEDEVLNWKTYSWEMRSVWLENILLHRPKRWLPETFPNYDELLTAAVEAAVNGPETPKDLASWRWGAFNAVEIEHPILGRIPVIRSWSGPGVQEQSGSGYTVKAVTRHHGPSERFTANLADLDQSTLNLVTGQGGNFLSPYYMDQWKAWCEGTTFALPFSGQAVEAAKAHRLVLEPNK